MIKSEIMRDVMITAAESSRGDLMLEANLRRLECGVYWFVLLQTEFWENGLSQHDACLDLANVSCAVLDN